MKHLSMRGARPSLRLTRAAGLLLAVVLPLFAAEVAKATDRFTTDSLQYQHSWTVPEGVITTTVELVGASGGGVGGIAGRVDATLTDLSPGTSLTVCLGGGGLQATAFHGGGGIGGGGNAPPGAYGGGGSTDIRLAASCTVGADTRLFVAGGGGGMGGQSSDGRVGGFGGSVIDAAQAGVSYGDEFFLHVTGGGGGGAASTLANGSGGPGGVAGNTDARPTSMSELLGVPVSGLWVVVVVSLLRALPTKVMWGSSAAAAAAVVAAATSPEAEAAAEASIAEAAS